MVSARQNSLTKDPLFYKSGFENLACLRKRQILLPPLKKEGSKNPLPKSPFFQGGIEGDFTGIILAYDYQFFERQMICWASSSLISL